MNKWNKNIPDGTRDILFGEAQLYADIESKLGEIFMREGFNRVITPALEYYDVFDYSGQAIDEEAMYKLTDSNGRLIVLRADNTTPAARITATKLRNAPLPLKLFYNQNIYRINSDFSGRRSEIPQSGIEIIGAVGIRSDLICIMTALDALASLGIDYKIEIGHVGYYNALISEMDLDDDRTKQIRGYVDSKNAVSLGLMNKLADKSANFDKIRRIPLMFGGAEVFESATKLAGENAAALEALDYVRRLYDALVSAGYGEHVIIDMGMIHKIDYYTGAVFAGYIDGAGEPVLKGGRYDNLIENFDYNVPATGFAVNIAAVADVLKLRGDNDDKNDNDKKEKISYIIHFSEQMFSEAEKYKRTLASQGFPAEYSCFENAEDTLAYALCNGIKFVAFIESDKSKRIIEVN